MNEMQLQLQKRVELGYIRAVRHPKYPLTIYNYTDACTFDRAWDEYTLMSRGLILHDDGRIIAKGFNKFFNLGEMPETYLTNLPASLKYEVYDKADGSLGIVFNYEGEWLVATRGSFTSDQAIEAMKILTKYDLTQIQISTILLVEIIYPENRIIMDYGQERKLVLLSVLTMAYGDFSFEYDREAVEITSVYTGMPLVDKYNMTIEQCLEMQDKIPKLQEGWVVRFENGLRVKIKGTEYMKIAKIISQLSPISLWEVMKLGRVATQYLQQIPEEFRPQWEPMVEALETRYMEIHEDAQMQVIQMKNMGIDTRDYKKVGIFIKENPSLFRYAELVWPIVRHNLKQLDKAIMTIIRPTGNVL